MMHRPVFDAENFVADFGGAVGVTVFEIAPNHALDDAVFGDIVGAHVKGFDRAPVAEDGDLIGNRLDLIQLVTDEDRCDALLLQMTQQVEQMGGIFVV